jgi:hypothetical protein
MRGDTYRILSPVRSSPVLRIKDRLQTWVQPGLNDPLKTWRIFFILSMTPTLTGLLDSCNTLNSNSGVISEHL